METEANGCNQQIYRTTMRLPQDNRIWTPLHCLRILQINRHVTPFVRHTWLWVNEIGVMTVPTRSFCNIYDKTGLRMSWYQLSNFSHAGRRWRWEMRSRCTLLHNHPIWRFYMLVECSYHKIHSITHSFRNKETARRGTCAWNWCEKSGPHPVSLANFSKGVHEVTNDKRQRFNGTKENAFRILQYWSWCFAS